MKNTHYELESKQPSEKRWTQHGKQYKRRKAAVSAMRDNMRTDIEFDWSFRYRIVRVTTTREIVKE